MNPTFAVTCHEDGQRKRAKFTAELIACSWTNLIREPTPRRHAGAGVRFDILIA